MLGCSESQQSLQTNNLKKARKTTMKNPRDLKKVELGESENKALAEEVFFADHESKIQEILDKKLNSSATLSVKAALMTKFIWKI